MYTQKPGSPVLRLDKVTSGPVGNGTRYIEVVQMFPFVSAEIHSVVTRFEPPTWLAENFEGFGMIGQLLYQFTPREEGTYLIQREHLILQGLLRPLEPLVAWLLAPRLQERLSEIKGILEESLSEN